MARDLGSTRRAARERALSLLYEAEAKHVPVSVVVGELPVAPDPYAVEIAEGADTHRATIDALLQQAAVGWDVDRMAAVDRAVLRIATYELLERPDVPMAVVLDEAVGLVKRFSTENSGAFVNGVLATVARRTRSAEAALDGE
jgi:N utilization substance protein B